MGRCQYCGQSAGLFKTHHETCKIRQEIGWESMISRATKALTSGEGRESLEEELRVAAGESYVPTSSVREALNQAWQRAVSLYLDDDLLTEEEEKRLQSFLERFKLEQRELDSSGAMTRVVKAGTLRDVMQGEVPDRVNVIGDIPFNLQKGEQFVWAFQNAVYFVEKSRTVYQGRSAGVSIRVMRGVYYRTGVFRGYPSTTTYTAQEDVGLLGFTTKNLYFAGQRRAFRIPYTKIIALQPYSDGIGVQKDGVSAKPLIFTTGDGWFTYNLLTNLSRIGIES